MDGDENLPKATVSSFVKENVEGMKCSNEFIDLILRVSREYINVIADEANKICLSEGKKTIAPYYIYAALRQRQLESQITELEDAKKRFTEENHKSQNDLYKNPELVKMLTQQQERLFEQSRNKTEAQIIGLDKIQSGENYMNMDLSDITKQDSLQLDQLSIPILSKAHLSSFVEDSEDYED